MSTVLHSVKIFTISTCPYCKKLRSYLSDRRVPFKELEVLNADERSQIKKLYPEAKLFPVVIIDAKYIGGYEETVTWYEKEVEAGRLPDVAVQRT